MCFFQIYSLIIVDEARPVHLKITLFKIGQLKYASGKVVEASFSLIETKGVAFQV
jgi:hypothetical protein